MEQLSCCRSMWTGGEPAARLQERDVPSDVVVARMWNAKYIHMDEKNFCSFVNPTENMGKNLLQQFCTFQPCPPVEFSWNQVPAGYPKTTQTYWKTDGTESAPVHSVVFLYPTKDGKAHLNRKQKVALIWTKISLYKHQVRPNRFCWYTIKFISVPHFPLREQIV